MSNTHRFEGLVTLLFASMQVGARRPDTPKPSVQLITCQVRGIKGEAKCGTLEVFENRDTRKGRKIPINVVVLPASGSKRDPDALFYFPGGPGSAATEDAPGLVDILARIRQHSHLAFV